MNKTNKLLSLLLVLTIVFSLSVTALAADKTYTITIDGSGTVANHTFEAYQIFSGDLHTPETAEGGTASKILSNIVWGTGVDTSKDGFDAAFPESAAATAEKLITVADAQAFAQKIAPFLSTTHTDCSTKDDSGNYQISGLPAGYYLVKDKDDTLTGANDFYTAYLMKVVADVTATPKGSKPTLKKELRDKKDAQWDPLQAGFQIGDQIEFRLISSVPDIGHGYNAYSYTITDTMSSGLTSNVKGKTDVSIKVNDNADLSDAYYTVAATGNTFTVTVNIKAAMDAGEIAATNALYVYYTAELNDTTKYFQTGWETNEAFLTYPNDPNSESTGKTPEAVVKVVTFPTSISKVDGKTTAPLTGAKFVLSTDPSLKIADLNLNKNFEPQTTDKLIALHGTNDPIAPYRVASPEMIAAKDNITYVIEAGDTTIAGLGEKSYYLYEIKAPNGYNLLPEATKFTLHLRADDISTLAGTPYLTLGESTTEQHLALTIANNAGATLPETGGIGTTLFYVIGALLVVGAGVLLVTKKRMGKADN
ncbi:MAG: SpaH/EbpB family LPXTG-anchored major pilin [Oscillospiraceae bacterium]